MKKQERHYKAEKIRPDGSSSFGPTNGNKLLREPVTPIGKIPPIPKSRKPRTK